jgi:hypothetical protein
MRALILKLKNKIATTLVLVTAATLVSCASQKEQVAIVNDPDSKKGESMIPWDKQEKWETQGQMANITDRR